MVKLASTITPNSLSSLNGNLGREKFGTSKTLKIRLCYRFWTELFQPCTKPDEAIGRQKPSTYSVAEFLL